MGLLPPSNSPSESSTQGLPPRILLIDSYDSFTHNLAALCRLAVPDCVVHIIRNDSLTYTNLVAHLPYFSAVVVGPGPGSPANPADIGVVGPLWNMPNDRLLPVFGVCLGLQTLALAHGAQLKRLAVVKHGLLSDVQHTGADIFEGVGVVHAVRYHSLHVALQEGGPVEALAHADDGSENGRVLMAARHRTKPFWGVQYHPESARTHGGGQEVLRNFWDRAQRWSSERKREPLPWSSAAEALFGPAWPSLRPHSPPASPLAPLPSVHTVVLEACTLPVTDICEVLGAADESAPFVLLDSAAAPGRFSIIGSLITSTIRIMHAVGDAHVSVKLDGIWHREALGSRDVWSWVASFMRSRRFKDGHQDIPFWGGLVGCLSYEVGVNTLSIPLSRQAEGEAKARHPDVNLVFVERSVVVDSKTGKVYVQSLLPKDAWVLDTAATLSKATLPVAPSVEAFVGPPASSCPLVTLPDKDLYISRIQAAQAHLAAGDSYELCLTAPTRVLTPRIPSWSLYKSARANNPAPHAAFLRLSPTTLVSTSPERFLSFSRGSRPRCELRPIKGTLRKGPDISRADAERALAGSAKEVAENLMIVDLIRHDLHGVLGEDVRVSQFCAIEEYRTVWQMVSVVEGRLPEGCTEEEEREVGWEVLRRGLPPGSMTGAPKKRSVEILQTLEDAERSIYSGVFGYWCVGGGGDWAVTIRSCFKLDDINDGAETNGMPQNVEGDARGNAALRECQEEWVVGAGGAITALSDPHAEWEEMVLKLNGVLRAFRSTTHTVG